MRRLVWSMLSCSFLLGCDSGEGLGQPPVAVLKAPSFCDLGAVVTLDGTGSTDPEGEIVLYRFIISDGSAAREVVGPKVDHTCRIMGLIGVTLEVHDARGNTGQASATISVRPP